MLEGSVQRAGGESFRVTAQLIDALNGNHVWAESYDRELADIFAVKNEITLNIVANIGAVTEVGERDRAVRNETESLDAWLLWREGRSKFALFQQEENHLARQNFLAALEIDPDFKSAMTELGNTYRSDAMFFWSDFDVAIEEAFKYYGQVLEVDPLHASTLSQIAFTHNSIGTVDLVDPSRKSGGALHRLHCFCLEFDGACEVQRRVPTDWVIEPINVSGYGSFSLAS